MVLLHYHGGQLVSVPCNSVSSWLCVVPIVVLPTTRLYHTIVSLSLSLSLTPYCGVSKLGTRFLCFPDRGRGAATAFRLGRPGKGVADPGKLSTGAVAVGNRGGREKM